MCWDPAGTPLPPPQTHHFLHHFSPAVQVLSSRTVSSKRFGSLDSLGPDRQGSHYSGSSIHCQVPGNAEALGTSRGIFYNIVYSVTERRVFRMTVNMDLKEKAGSRAFTAFHTFDITLPH